MPTTYAEFDSTPGTLVADLRTRILASTDWADLSPTGVLTTLSSTQTTSNGLVLTDINAVAIGSVYVINKGGATEERFTVTSKSGSTAVVSPSLAVLHAAGETIHSGAALLKATTTRGAQMVVDLADAVPTSVRLGLAAYRTHDGTTGVDKASRVLAWRNSGGALTDPLHVVVSAGKEHLYVSVEGPRGGEPNAVNTTGSTRQCFAFGDIVPYFPNADVVPAVVLVASLVNQPSDATCWVSRNAANTASWVPARLGTVCIPLAPGAPTNAPQSLPARRPDGSRFAWPYVVCETADGPRGRLAPFHHLGMSASGVAGDPTPVPGERLTIGGVAHIATVPYETTDASSIWTAFGVAVNNASNTTNPVVLIPVA